MNAVSASSTQKLDHSGITHMRATHTASSRGSTKDAARTLTKRREFASRSVSRGSRVTRAWKSLAEAHPNSSAIEGIVLLATRNRIAEESIADRHLPGEPLAD